MNKSDTPETDSALCVLPPEPGWPEGRKATVYHDFVVTEHFARRLEREKNAAEDAAVGAMEECRKLKAINSELVDSLRVMLENEDMAPECYSVEFRAVLANARATLAKAKEAK